MNEKYYDIKTSEKFVNINFSKKCNCLSSAIYNGGFQEVSSGLIINVEENFNGKKSDFEDPEITIKNAGEKIGINSPFFGMMTSAKMSSFRTESEITNDVIVSAFLTAGVSNAKRIGEKAEWQNFEHNNYSAGTINIILFTNVSLSFAAMTEAIMMITEAKSAALQDLKVLTDKNNIATGTGTDSTAIVCSENDKKAKYCGKHTLIGEMTGKTVYRALINSLK